MLEDKLPELVRSLYNIRILVSASYKAKETFAAKGITPAVFLDPFYRDKNSKIPMEVAYNLKERSIKPLPDFVPIDLSDYELIRKEPDDAAEDIDESVVYKKIMDELQGEKLKHQRGVDKDTFSSRSEVEKFLNNQSYHWFEHSNKYFHYSTSLGQKNYSTGMQDQPQGVAYVIEVEKDKNAKDVFEKIKNDTDFLLRRLYELNPDQIKNLKTMVIIMFDSSQGARIEEALQYTTVLKNHFGISSALIYRMKINGEDAADSIEWSRFNRPLMHFKYQLKTSDPIRIIAYEEIAKVQEVINHHKDTIRLGIETRLGELCKRH